MTVAIGAMVNARCSAANKHRNLRKSWPHRCMVPKAEQAMPEVLAAAETLTHAAEREIAWMFLARIATLRAIHRDEARVFNPDRKDTHWGKRKPKRDR